MPIPKSKRQTRSRSNISKTPGGNRAAQVTACKTAKRRAGGRSAFVQQLRRAESKQARIIAMLRTPSGVTIDAMVQATGWQPHSVRGFLAGVIRKKLGLNLISTAAETGRVYRIAERMASTVVATNTSHAG